ncbi:hypothetical protein GW17_00048093 [Ensete ventricosum]|nr:hypothetical protein GW17_00048093 [Ensete ventricosum]
MRYYFIQSSQGTTNLSSPTPHTYLVPPDLQQDRTFPPFRASFQKIQQSRDRNRANGGKRRRRKLQHHLPHGTRSGEQGRFKKRFEEPFERSDASDLSRNGALGRSSNSSPEIQP